MRNLFLTIFAVICLATVNSQNVVNTWNLDWQNTGYANLCLPQSVIVYNDTTITTQLDVNYTYDPNVLTNICPGTVATHLTDILTDNNGNFTDTFGRSFTFNNSYILFTTNETGVMGTTFFYQTAATQIQQTLVYGTLASTWTNPSVVIPSAEPVCCVPDVVSFLPESTGTTLLYSAQFNSGNACAAGVNVSGQALTLTGSNVTTINWNGTVNVQYITAASEYNITVALFPGNNTCVYNYQRQNAAGPNLNNVWIQDWQSQTTTVFPTQYNATTTTVYTNITYTTSQYTLNSGNVNSYVVQNGAAQYFDVNLNQNFTYDQPTQTLLSGTFLYSLNGSILSPTPFIGFWGTPVATGDTTGCCVPTYVNISANPANNNTLSVVYTLPEGYASVTGCAALTSTNGVVTSTLGIGQPSISQLNWVDGYTNTLTGNGSAITANFQGQCTYEMVITAPPPPAITTGTFYLAWQNNNNDGICLPASFTLTQNASTNAVNVTYTYAAEVLTHCSDAAKNEVTATYAYTNGTFSDAAGRSITINGTSIYLTPTTGAAAYFYVQTIVQQPPTYGVLGASWNAPSPAPGTCCVPDSLSLIPSSAGQNAFAYSATYITCTTGVNVSNVPLSLSGSTAALINYVDSVSSPTIQIQYVPGQASISVTNVAGTCSSTYARVPAAGPALSQTWVQDWQSPNGTAFPDTYLINNAETTVPGNAITYMTSLYNNGGPTDVNSYVVQTGNVLYTDAYLNETFTYDANTQSLLSGNFLYSLNGSVLSSAPFVTNWGSPITASNATTCCTPILVNITTNPANNYSLLATYTLPEGYSSNNNCQEDFTGSTMAGGLVDATLTINQPSFTQLTWVDNYGLQFTINAGDSTTLISTVTDVCNFTMTAVVPPNPNPEPLAGSWMSTKVMGMVMGLFVVLAWF